MSGVFHTLLCVYQEENYRDEPALSSHSLTINIITADITSNVDLDPLIKVKSGLGVFAALLFFFPHNVFFALKSFHSFYSK